MRAPLDLSRGRPTSTVELLQARQLIERSGVLEVLGPRLDSAVGRPRHLSLLGFLVTCQLNATHRHHQAHLVEAARTLNALTEEQRNQLGIRSWDSDEAYWRVERLFLKLCGVLEDGSAGVNATWFANALTQAAIPTDARLSHTVAVDGTDLETWGALRGDDQSLDLDGETAEARPDATNRATSSRRRRRAKVLAIGPDGRKQYTADPDARAGHRSATTSRPAGPYVGYELHLAVQAREVRWTNGIDRITLGPEVPGVITSCSLTPAGTHRGRAIVPTLLDSLDQEHPLNEVIWDPGYSLCRPETTVYPLAQAGVTQTFQPVTHQRGPDSLGTKGLKLDGQLFSAHTPEELWDLPMPPRGANEDQKRAYQHKFNQRARWRLVRHAGPDRDGVTRWRCPFCAGLLRSRNFPRTMRRARAAPLVQVNGAVSSCCSGTISVAPSDLPLAQAIAFGTTAWHISMARRQVVESVNAALKGGFIDIARGFLRVFGRVKATVLLAFSIAAFNLERVRSFRAKHAAVLSPRRRSTRRKGTWVELIASEERPPDPTSTGPPG